MKVQHGLGLKLNESKNTYSRKLKVKLQQNDRDVWTRLNVITGYKVRDRQPVGMLECANELKCFFNRSPYTPTCAKVFALSPLIPLGHLCRPKPWLGQETTRDSTKARLQALMLSAPGV